MATLSTIHVVAGVLRDADGRVLICQRPAGKHMAGDWEFPGGKRHDDETSHRALARELDEELGVTLHRARPLIRYHHAYPDRIIDLDVWQVDEFTGEPAGREGQAIEWVEVAALTGRSLLPADRPIITALRLGSLCLVTGAYSDARDFRERLDHALQRGATLVQVRDHRLGPAGLRERVAQALEICRQRDVRLVVNGDPTVTVPLAEATGADGLHLPARFVTAGTRSTIPSGMLVGASCHDAEELRRAAIHGADYAVLGPVADTPSHPGAPVIGWDRFATLVAPVAMPVYGIGGLSPATLDRAWGHGAQGIAAITALWS